MTQSGRPLVAITAVSALLILLADQALYACPVCFQIDDAATTSGIYAAVFVLLGVTGGVLTGVAAFIARFVRNARRDSRTESVTTL
jgi:heme/copper-type cytochrome/quinol oxidase subunit 2